MSESYWWCPNCREEVDGHHVTYQEQHEVCGHLVESISITPEKQERLAELEAELTKVKECNMALHKMMMAKQDLLEAELAGKDKCLSEMEDEIIRLQSIIDRRY